MHLSVVIPCLNGAGTVATQLEALANQYWSKPWEVIFVDNGSIDNSLEIVERYKGQIPNLQVIDASDRRGVAYARNKGALTASSGAIAFCDVDDEVAPGWVAAMGEALCKHDFVVCQIEDEKLNPPWIRVNWRPPKNGPEPFMDFLPAAATWGIGVKRLLHEEIGGFDEYMMRLSDVDYCWRAQLAGARLQFVPEAVVHYRYRHTLSGIFRQAYLTGLYQVYLYKKYGLQGMPWRPWKQGIRAWLYLVQGVTRVRHKNGQVKWIRQLGMLSGQLCGSIKYRVVAL